MPQLTMCLADVDARSVELIAILRTMLPRFESWDVLDDPRGQLLFAPFVHLRAFRSLVPPWMHAHAAERHGRLDDPTNRQGRGASWERC